MLPCQGFRFACIWLQAKGLLAQIKLLFKMSTERFWGSDSHWSVRHELGYLRVGSFSHFSQTQTLRLPSKLLYISVTLLHWSTLLLGSVAYIRTKLQRLTLNFAKVHLTYYCSFVRDRQRSPYCALSTRPNLFASLLVNQWEILTQEEPLRLGRPSKPLVNSLMISMSRCLEIRC